MKKLLVFVGLIFVSVVASATTVNINWLMDGDIYAQTSCETGGNFTLPTTPTKYGYHFVGWQQGGSIGYWEQSGTPTPDNPIEPTFRQFGNTVLRAVGSGNNLIADIYDVSTGKITRRIGAKVLDGSENISVRNLDKHIFLFIGMSNNALDNGKIVCTHFDKGTSQSLDGINDGEISAFSTSANGRFTIRMSSANTVEQVRQWLADQYTNGTPVIIYYPLATPVEEAYNAQ